MELSSKFKLELDSEPILSRDLTLSPLLPKAAEDSPALFMGGSNADRLANAAANVGIVPDTVTEGGWILNTTSVSTVLPQIEACCLTLPAEAPVVLYCLDNSSFCQADSDGVISQIVKLADNKFHVVGELIVAYEITMAASVANIKRILVVCCDRKVYIITPLLRFINAACCGDVSHCTHRLVPESATKLLLDLARLHHFIESRISSFTDCEVIPAGDLLAAKNGATMSEVLAAYASWGAVHGNSTAYTRMALTLVDKVWSGNFKKPLQQQPVSGGTGKRKRTESGTSTSSNRSAGGAQLHHRRDGQRPGFVRGGSRGGGRGNPGKRGGNYSGPRDTRYDKFSSHGGRSGSGSGGGFGNSSGYGSGGGGGYKSRF